MLAHKVPLPELGKPHLPQPGEWDAAGFQAQLALDSRNPHAVDIPHSGHRGPPAKPPGPTCQAGTPAETEDSLLPFLDDSGP